LREYLLEKWYSYFVYHVLYSNFHHHREEFRLQDWSLSEILDSRKINIVKSNQIYVKYQPAKILFVL
jgi:hypothetical protein